MKELKSSKTVFASLHAMCYIYIYIYFFFFYEHAMCYMETK